MKNEQTEIDLQNAEFENIWKLIRFTNQSVFMTGRAGTGKSTFLKYICAHTSKKHVVLAPTGIAAVNAGGMTLHSFFRIPFKPLMPDDPEFAIDRLRKRLKYTKSHAKLIRELDLIIIDEISMVRADIIDFIDKVLRVYSGKMNQPFGGKQMLFVGDLFQLEPVVTADMRNILRQHYANAYFFSADAFRDLDIVPIELRKVYRQQDEDFIGLLDRFRIGSPTQEDVARLNCRVQPEERGSADGSFVMTLATRREMVDSINERRLLELPAPAVTYMGCIHDDYPESSLPTSKELVLKTGAQIVFVRNDRERRWVNGTVAKVYSATPDRLEVELESGARHVVEREIWENIVYKYDEETKKVSETVIGTFTQFPIRLAWALTIHKSQGLTFGNVVIDVGRGAFSGGQTYVALSRCRSLDGIALRSTINPRDVFVNPSVIDFSRKFNNQRLVDSALERAKADDSYQRAAEAFDGRRIGEAVDAFVEALTARSELKKPAVVRLIKQKLYSLSAAEKRVSELEERIEADRRRFEQLADEYVEMGRDCLDEFGDLTSALANFNKALSISPAHGIAKFEKGRALLLAGEQQEAVALFSSTLQADPGNLKAMFGISDAYRAMGDLHNALDYMLRAVDAHPKTAEVHSRLASLYEEAHDPESAAAHRSLAARLSRRKKK